jgi:hypothetical protein
MKQIILIKNDKLKQSAFAIDYCFYLYENIIKEVDFNTIESLILKKEKEILKKYSSGSDGVTKLGSKSLTSRHQKFNVLKWNHKEIKKLQKYILLHTKEFLTTLLLPIPGDLKIQCWANVMRKGEKIQTHLHDCSHKAYISGHLCVSSMTTHTYYIDPLKYFAGKDQRIYKSKNEVGKITLFSANIPHYTDTVMDDKERITLAFDITTGESFLKPNEKKL